MENLVVEDAILRLKNVSISYTPGKNAVDNVTADIQKNSITSIMGPSGCGKTTLLRAINRMHELYPGIVTSGEILLAGKDILKMAPTEVRRMAGMVFQRPNPCPTLSIYDNVISGYTLNGIKKNNNEKDEIVETSLSNVNLWDEVKHRQQQIDRLLSMPLLIPKMFRVEYDDQHYGRIYAISTDNMKDILPYV